MLHSFFKHLVVTILTAEAHYLVRRKKPYVIAVTGSVGKTSTKDAIYTALKDSVSVRKSEKSFNSEIGVPLTVLGLPNAWGNPFGWLRNIIDGGLTALTARQYPEVLVIEAGVDTPGDMERLTKWLQPQMVVLTRLPDVPVHVEQFRTPAAVIAEKMRLVDALPPDGVLIYNHDDVLIQKQLASVLPRAVSFGRYGEVDVRITRDSIVYRDDVPVAVRCGVSVRGESAPLELLGVAGLPATYAAAAAIAVATERGVPLTTAAQRLSKGMSANGRLRILPGIKGTTIIDDTYNASPVAMEEALATLRDIKYAKRRIAVLGDMLELGKFSASEHERIGALCAGTVDTLLTVGIRARGFASGTLAHGVPESVIRQYDDVARAGRELQALLQPGDVVLVKGSQGMRLERVVEEVMAEPERAEELLVRQDPAWRSR